MSDKNMFLGDTTYPHTKTKLQINRELISAEFDHFFEFETGDKSQVTSVSCRLFAGRILQKSNERIEQLERELAEAQKGHARYEYVRKLNVRQFQEIFIRNLSGEYHFDDLIDAAIQERKA